MGGLRSWCWKSLIFNANKRKGGRKGGFLLGEGEALPYLFIPSENFHEEAERKNFVAKITILDRLL